MFVHVLPNLTVVGRQIIAANATSTHLNTLLTSQLVTESKLDQTLILHQKRLYLGQNRVKSSLTNSALTFASDYSSFGYLSFL